MIKSFLFYTFLFVSIHGMLQNPDEYIFFNNLTKKRGDCFRRIKPVPAAHDNDMQTVHYKPKQE
jgi:hypothetical protein